MGSEMCIRDRDIGPEGGDGGGELIAYGSPEKVVNSKSSHTAKYLKPLLM